MHSGAAAGKGACRICARYLHKKEEQGNACSSFAFIRIFGIRPKP